MLNNEIVRNTIMNQFLNYANAYDITNGKVNLKIVHTQQVANVMEELTHAMGLSEHLSLLAYYCAVYHDIGRFEQILRYGTFNDMISTDHASLSCEVLKQKGLLKELCMEDQNKVLVAIEQHNKLFIAKDIIDSETLLLCKLIRDADKLDIFRVFAYEDMVDTMGETIAQVSKETITDYVMETFMKHQCIDKNQRITGLDKWISFLGFVYDMNYSYSFHIMKREKHYRIPFEKAVFQNPETQRRVYTILEELEKYMDERTAL